uniref:Protein kinase domain-containing protein n=1 Tax=Brassica campestris TaxID=3711 RepID=M4EG03_BRACM
MKVVVAKKGSSQTSRPSSAQSNRSESSGLSNVVNPFGHAKPREVLLQRSGLIKNPGVQAELVRIQKEHIPGLDPIDESRSFESTERPRSRGAVDAWVRPVDDQPRNFQGGSKERGFFSNRLIMLLSSFCYERQAHDLEEHKQKKRRVENFRIDPNVQSGVYRARDLTHDKIVALKKVRFDLNDIESVKFMVELRRTVFGWKRSSLAEPRASRGTHRANPASGPIPHKPYPRGPLPIRACVLEPNPDPKQVHTGPARGQVLLLPSLLTIVIVNINLHTILEVGIVILNL